MCRPSGPHSYWQLLSAAFVIVARFVTSGASSCTRTRAPQRAPPGARRFEASGVGLGRTEHTFLGERREVVERLILAVGDGAPSIRIGTMIEVPRAALTASEIAHAAEFFSFGTNDLTQMTWGFSDDVEGAFFSRYLALGRPRLRPVLPRRRTRLRVLLTVPGPVARLEAGRAVTGTTSSSDSR